MDGLSSPERAMLHRVLWWFAIIGMALAFSDLTSFIAQMAETPVGIWSIFARYRNNPGLKWYFVGLYGKQISDVLLILGTCGMIMSKQWSGPVVMTWVLLYLPCLAIAAVANSMLSYPASTPPSGIRGDWIWLPIANFVMRSAFPLAFLILLRQPELRDLWTRKGSGAFAIIPIARHADGEKPAREGPGNGV